MCKIKCANNNFIIQKLKKKVIYNILMKDYKDKHVFLYNNMHC